MAQTITGNIYHTLACSQDFKIAFKLTIPKKADMRHKPNRTWALPQTLDDLISIPNHLQRSMVCYWIGDGCDLMANDSISKSRYSLMKTLSGVSDKSIMVCHC